MSDVTYEASSNYVDSSPTDGHLDRNTAANKTWHPETDTPGQYIQVELHFVLRRLGFEFILNFYVFILVFVSSKSI